MTAESFLEKHRQGTTSIFRSYTLLEHKRSRCLKFGIFKETTEFIPFWSQREFYSVRRENLETPGDLNQVFDGKPAAPLFGHTAPGVLVSAYKNENRALFVLVNPTDQALGKLGHLWIDHPRLFGLDENAHSATLVRQGQMKMIDIESGAEGGAKWNRNGGGWIPNYWFNIAILPGDYKLILVEVDNG